MRAMICVAVLAAWSGCRCDGRDARADGVDPIPIPIVDVDQLRRDLATDQAIAQLADRSLQAYQRAAEALEAAGDDCDAAARSLQRILERDAETIARAQTVSDVPELLTRARPILEQRAERTRELGARLDAATVRCGEHPAVARMLRHF